MLSGGDRMAVGMAKVAAALVDVGLARQFEELLCFRAKSLLVVHYWALRTPRCIR